MEFTVRKTHTQMSSMLKCKQVNSTSSANQPQLNTITQRGTLFFHLSLFLSLSHSRLFLVCCWQPLLSCRSLWWSAGASSGAHTHCSGL